MRHWDHCSNFPAPINSMMPQNPLIDMGLCAQEWNHVWCTQQTMQLINLNVLVSTEKLSKFNDLAFSTCWSSDTENITEAQRIKHSQKVYWTNHCRRTALPQILCYILRTKFPVTNAYEANKNTEYEQTVWTRHKHKFSTHLHTLRVQRCCFHQ